MRIPGAKNRDKKGERHDLKKLLRQYKVFDRDKYRIVAKLLSCATEGDDKGMHRKIESRGTGAVPVCSRHL